LIDRETLGMGAAATGRDGGAHRADPAGGRARAPPGSSARALGEQWRLPFIDLLNSDIDESLVRELDPEVLLAEGWVPVIPRRRSDGRGHLRAADRGAACAGARAPGTKAPKSNCGATTPLDIERTIVLCFREHIVRRSTGELLEQRPELSAAGGWSLGQKRWVFAAGLLTLIGMSYAVAADRRRDRGRGANVTFLAAVTFKLVACLVGVVFGARVTDASPERDDRRLPRYTVLVPVYHEANVIGELMGNLGALDYPAEKLEVLVLLESDDTETIEAARAAEPPATVRLVIVPDAQPKTKPKACNVGLFLARGDLLVIYDAEDRPDPQQLRKAVAAFEQAGAETICMQARLRYWNYDDEPAHANVHARVRILVRHDAARARPHGPADTARRHLQPFSRTRAAGSDRVGSRTTSPRTPTSACGPPSRATASV
jgi:hypothetical protein